MFIYLFTNKLFINSPRKIVSSFPLPQSFIQQLKDEGWIWQEEALNHLYDHETNTDNKKRYGKYFGEHFPRR